MNAGSGSRGRLFVFSAPSGAGKSTLIQALRKKFPALGYSVSHTTRKPREGEKDGVDYFFIDHAGFEAMIREDVWLEWARVHDNYYGTSAAFISDALGRGQHVVLDIDVQGAAQVKTRFPDGILIFIEPPSMEVLRARLENRGTDAPDVIARRMENAVGEMARKGAYDHVVVNDDLETAINELTRIIGTYI